jgi:hypothetical protein
MPPRHIPSYEFHDQPDTALREWIRLVSGQRLTQDQLKLRNRILTELATRQALRADGKSVILAAQKKVP